MTVPRDNDGGDDQRGLIDAAWRQIGATGSSTHGLSPELMRRLRSLRAEPDSVPGYRIIEEIHRGGQGVVFKAVQRSTQRLVAIKVMREGPFATADERSRFEREVRVLARLKHPNIVSIYHSDAVDGRFFYVMDYIAGQTLDEYIAAAKRSVAETMRLFAVICEAVAAAHLRGVIHRDLKPGNVRVDVEGVPHVLDFGLSKMADEAEASGATRTGQFVGSAPWASPEQAAGDIDAVDLRTDVYSLGVLLFQMLTGEFPYDVTGRPQDVLANVMHAEPRKPSSLRREIDDDVETIVLRCLQKDRERRYQSGVALAADVRRYLAGEPIEARRDSGWYIIRKQLWRHRATLGVAAGFLLLLIASSVVAWWLYASAQRARGAAEQATTEANRRLWQSYLAQARAARSTRKVGRRFDSLAAIRQAAMMRPSLELRNEAIAAMALSDIRIERRYPAHYHAAATGLNRIDRFARSDEQGTVEVVAVEDGRIMTRLRGPPHPSWIFVFSRDGRYLATKHHAVNAETSELCVWDVQRGELVLRLPPGQYRGTGVAFAADNAWVALTETDERIHFYGLPSGEHLDHRTIDALDPRRIDLEPAGRRLASSGFVPPFVEIWDVETGERVGTVDAPALIRGMSWSEDGKLLAGACTDGRVYLWDAGTGERLGELVGHQGEAVDVHMDPEGRFMTTWAWDNSARIWRSDTMEEIFESVQGWVITNVRDRLAFEERPHYFTIAKFEPSREFTRLAWPTAGNWQTAQISRDGAFAVTAGQPGVVVWDLGRGEAAIQLSEEPTESCIMLPDDTVLALGRAGLWSWRLIRRNGSVEAAERRLLHAEAGLVRMAGAADGSAVAVLGQDHFLILDPRDGTPLRSLPAFESLRSHLSLSPDARRLFAGTWRGEPARVLDVESGETLLSIDNEYVIGSFSRDGNWLAVSLRTQYLFYDTRDWRLVRRIDRSSPETLAGTAAFTERGDLAAIQHSRFVVHLIEPDSGRLLAVLPNPSNDAILSLSFTPDGSRLAAATADRYVLVWRIDAIRRGLRDMGLDWVAE